MLNWMAWTLPTGLFFAGIGLILMGMTLWERWQPTVERKGWLPLVTTRGDRLFIGLLSSAFVHLAAVGLTDWDLRFVLAGCVLWVAALLRWG